MKKRFLSILFLSLSLGSALYAQQQFDWSVSHSTAQSRSNVTMNKITTDREGNIYTLGLFEGTLTIGGGLNQQMLNEQYANASNGQWELFVTKTTPGGAVQWARKFDKTSYVFNHVYNAPMPSGIVVDDSLNVYLAASFPGAIDANPGAASNIHATEDATLTTAKSAVIIKLDEQGTYVWSRHITRNESIWFPGLSYKRGIDIRLIGFNITSNGILYGYGNLGSSQAGDTLTFDPGGQNLIKTFSDTSDTRPFWFEIDKVTGNFSNTGYFKKNASGSIQHLSVQYDNARNKYVTAIFAKTVDISLENNTSQILATPNPAASSTGSFVAKYDSTNAIIWSRLIRSSKNTSARAIAADESGQLFVTGDFQDTTTFTDPNNTNIVLTVTASNTVAAPSNTYVARYDTAGNLKWATKLDFGQTNDVNTTTSAIATDELGVPYVSGQVYGEFNRVGIGYQNYRHGFVSKVDTGGAQLWFMRYGTIPFFQGEVVNMQAVHLDSSNNLYTCGSIRQAGINASPLQQDTNWVALTGTQTAYLLKYSCSDTARTLLSTSACNQYVFDNQTFTQSGEYIFHYWSAGGCDSTVVLDLTVNYIDKPFITVNNFTLGVTSNYATYRWLKNGVLIPGATQATYNVTENADYKVIVTTAAGCTDTSDVYTVDNVSPVFEHALSGLVTVYPNPVTDKVYIESPEAVQYYITGIEGKRLQDITAYHSAIDCSGLAAGIYFLHVLDREDRVIKVEKIVKQ